MFHGCAGLSGPGGRYRLGSAIHATGGSGGAAPMACHWDGGWVWKPRLGVALSWVDSSMASRALKRWAARTRAGVDRCREAWPLPGPAWAAGSRAGLCLRSGVPRWGKPAEVGRPVHAGGGGLDGSDYKFCQIGLILFKKTQNFNAPSRKYNAVDLTHKKPVVGIPTELVGKRRIGSGGIGQDGKAGIRVHAHHPAHAQAVVPDPPSRRG